MNSHLVELYYEDDKLESLTTFLKGSGNHLGKYQSNPYTQRFDKYIKSDYSIIPTDEIPSLDIDNIIFLSVSSRFTYTKTHFGKLGKFGKWISPNSYHNVTESYHYSISDINNYIKENTTRGVLFCLMSIFKIEIIGENYIPFHRYILNGCFINDEEKYNEYINISRDRKINTILK